MWLHQCTWELSQGSSLWQSRDLLVQLMAVPRSPAVAGPLLCFCLVSGHHLANLRGSSNISACSFSSLSYICLLTLVLLSNIALSNMPPKSKKTLHTTPCFQFEGSYYIDTSLPLGLRWAGCHCQEVTNMVSHELRRQGLTLLSYIDDLGGVARSRPAADLH